MNSNNNFRGQNILNSCPYKPLLPKPNPNNCNNGCKLPKPPPNKHIDFRQFKKNTIQSLNEVEYFLNNFNKALTCIKLYKVFK